ncbi:leucine-rich repeat domain-containing protein [Desulfococcaceae bacterium HSG7]|nr:leucine-rich repeat domain-containing protein [Desulfococcaceae bacterium HSG7]
MNRKATKMKRTFLILFPCILLLVMAGANEVRGEDPVVFNDPNLKAAVEAKLGISDPTPTQMLALTNLKANVKGIVDLTGLEYADNLTALELSRNQISDISPLSTMTGLTRLWLEFNQISDISPLSEMTGLRYLSLHSNQISDISPLSERTWLMFLRLSSNQISDISVLSGMTEMKSLLLIGNQISDISPLSEMTGLTTLQLNSNQISDISPLSEMTGMKNLSLQSNYISDISPLSEMTGMKYLWLGGNHISDISPLSEMTGLTILGLSGNHISDISLLSAMTGLTSLQLHYNQISDISPLSEMTGLIQLELYLNRLNCDAYSDFIPVIETNNPGIYMRYDPMPEQCEGPVADAGPNVSIASEEQSITVIKGSASDPDGNPLTYRWLEGEVALSQWLDVGVNGEADLNLSLLPPFSVGAHVLTLEVSDGQLTASDEMILTVENSAPNSGPAGGGVYEIFSSVILGGQVSDYDGDSLTYEWLEGQEVLFSGSVQTVNGGDPVNLPEHLSDDLDFGNHTLTLRIDDSVNDPISADISVEIVDTTAPTLVPIPSKTILWPPNHKMVDIAIEANASDNSGGPATLTARVTSNEPDDGPGDGNKSPDWTEPVIDEETGIIYLSLRSERSGNGDGRVYTITITAADEFQNESQTQVEIIVPHDKMKK